MSRFVELGLAGGPETDRIRALLEAAGALGERASGLGPAEAGITIPVGDDAVAFRPPPGEQLVVSSDASVEGVHFRREWMTWETIGYRAAAGALSDLAAMAASPIGMVLSVALPPELGIEAAAALGSGVGSSGAAVSAKVLGGDLVASPGPVFLDVTVVGHASRPVPRSGARPGDEIWVTGRLGGAASAIQDLENRLEPDPAALAALERPRPRIPEARWLIEHVEVHAVIDLSDGLARDARHMAAASGVAIQIDVARVPAPDVLDRLRDTVAGQRFMLCGGEDYELMIAVPPGELKGLAAEFGKRFDLELTRIGCVADGEGVVLDGTKLSGPLHGFDHFRGGS